MRLKLKKAVRMKGAPTALIMENSIVELPAEEAAGWIAKGYAKPADEKEESPAEIIEKEPDRAETAALAPAENAMMKRPVIKKQTVKK